MQSMQEEAEQKKDSSEPNKDEKQGKRFFFSWKPFPVISCVGFLGAYDLWRSRNLVRCRCCFAWLQHRSLIWWEFTTSI